MAALPSLKQPVAAAAKATGTDGRNAGDNDNDPDRDPPRPAHRKRDGRGGSGGAPSDRSGSANAPARGAKSDPKSLALYLALARTLGRISVDSGGQKAPQKRDMENTGKPTENKGKSAAQAANGRVSEWPKELVLKTGVHASVPWVRIPPLPVREQVYDSLVSSTIIDSGSSGEAWGCRLTTGRRQRPVA